MAAILDRTFNPVSPDAARIEAADYHSPRPLISIVVPTYEPTPHLIAALQSVLKQDLGPAQMQIAVIDDGSRTVDVAALVASADPAGRVEVHRVAKNDGLAGSWNRCVNMARGEIVHILHQDDWVADGFYRSMLPAFSATNVGMAFCRHALTDVNGNIMRVSHLERRWRGVLKNWLARICERQRMQCVSVLVRRSVYEQLGGFRSDLCYALDWEMWVRIALRYPVWYEPKMLAYYRRHDDNESARLSQAGKTYRDTLKAIEVFSGYLPDSTRSVLVSNAYASFARRTLKQVTSTAPNTPQDLEGILEIVNGAVQKITHSPRLQRLYRKRLLAIDEKWMSEPA